MGMYCLSCFSFILLMIFIDAPSQDYLMMEEEFIQVRSHNVVCARLRCCCVVFAHKTTMAQEQQRLKPKEDKESDEK